MEGASPADAGLAREAVAGLARALERVASEGRTAERQAAILEAALAALREPLEQRSTLTVSVEPGGLRFDGDPVYREPAGGPGFCSRLHGDGVRSLTFRRGLLLPELTALAQAAVPEAPESGEDSVTELWKADLGSIQYTAAPRQRLQEHPGAEGLAQEIERIAAQARKAVQHIDADASLIDRTQPPPLWSEEQRRKSDPQGWGDVARRAALTIARIVEHDLAGWDLEPLEETFLRLVDEMARRAEVPALVAALEGAARMGGAHAPSFRAFVARQLADRSRLQRAMELVAAPVKAAAQLIPAWTALLPDDAGPALVEALPGARAESLPALAGAAVRRLGSCRDELAAAMRTLPVPAALAVLSALPAAAARPRAELAAVALENPDRAVRKQAVPLVAADPQLALEQLGPLLADSALRAAAAEALSSCAQQAEAAAALLVGRLAPGKLPDEDLAVLYRALGRLGSSAGRAFLSERLVRPARGFLKRRRSEQEQLLAVEALAEDGSLSALRILDDAADPRRGHPAEVRSACVAAVERLRTRRQPRDGQGR